MRSTPPPREQAVASSIADDRNPDGQPGAGGEPPPPATPLLMTPAHRRRRPGFPRQHQNPPRPRRCLRAADSHIAYTWAIPQLTMQQSGHTGKQARPAARRHEPPAAPASPRRRVTTGRAPFNRARMAPKKQQTDKPRCHTHGTQQVSCPRRRARGRAVPLNTPAQPLAGPATRGPASARARGAPAHDDKPPNPPNPRRVVARRPPRAHHQHRGPTVGRRSPHDHPGPATSITRQTNSCAYPNTARQQTTSRCSSSGRSQHNTSAQTLTHHLATLVYDATTPPHHRPHKCASLHSTTPSTTSPHRQGNSRAPISRRLRPRIHAPKLSPHMGGGAHQPARPLHSDIPDSVRSLLPPPSRHPPARCSSSCHPSTKQPDTTSSPPHQPRRGTARHVLHLDNPPPAGSMSLRHRQAEWRDDLLSSTQFSKPSCALRASRTLHTRQRRRTHTPRTATPQ